MNRKMKILKQYQVYLDFQEFKKICTQIACGEKKRNATYNKKKSILEKIDDYLDFLNYKTERYMLIRDFIDEHTKDPWTGRSIINSCHGSFNGQYFFVYAETCQNQTISVNIPLDIFLVGEEDVLKTYIIHHMGSVWNS